MSISRLGRTATITPNALNQVASAGMTAFGYDADGQLLRDEARSYAWDAEGRLVGIASLANPADAGTLRYDGLGRRIAIGVVGGAETRYGWCGRMLCQSRTGADAVLRRYLAEGEAQASENQFLYYATDQLERVARRAGCRHGGVGGALRL